MALIGNQKLLGIKLKMTIFLLGMYSMRSMDGGVHSQNLTPVGAPPNVGQPAPPPTVSHNGTSTCTVLGAAGGAATEDRMEASSDSAVSSMGSERVPPMTDPHMSDNEWVDADSHPHGPHDLSPYSMDYSRFGFRSRICSTELIIIIIIK